MANTKSIVIQGLMPFDAYEDPEAMKFLAFLNGPVVGLKIEYLKKATYVQNTLGGKTALYPFIIAGIEAVRYEWVDWVVTTIERLGGKVTTKHCQDVEG